MAAVTAALAPFAYAVLRAVPRVDRGEFINVGVVLYCQERDFLRAAVALDPARLRALSPDIDLEAVRQAAEAVVETCRAPIGSARENAGLATRFGMVTAPRSTVLQPSPVHAGMTGDPSRTLAELMTRLVGPVEPRQAPPVDGMTKTSVLYVLFEENASLVPSGDQQDRPSNLE